MKGDERFAESGPTIDNTLLHPGVSDIIRNSVYEIAYPITDSNIDSIYGMVSEYVAFVVENEDAQGGGEWTLHIVVGNYPNVAHDKFLKDYFKRHEEEISASYSRCDGSSASPTGKLCKIISAGKVFTRNRRIIMFDESSQFGISAKDSDLPTDVLQLLEEIDGIQEVVVVNDIKEIKDKLN